MSSKQEKTTGIPPYVPCYAAKPPQIRRDLRNTALTNSGIQLVSAAQEGISLWLLAANVAAANKYQSNPPKKIEELLKTIDQLSNCLLGIISENKHNEIIIGNNKVNVQYREDITYVIELLQHEFTNELQKKNHSQILLQNCFHPT
ncbi:MAG: hypothetical protein HWD59_03625 [Coxiellaceae bacterium]|nr:MAG: hypothetical protein HWD59_03625 [Coxiellaceae bacterium]